MKKINSLTLFTLKKFALTFAFIAIGMTACEQHEVVPGEEEPIELSPEAEGAFYSAIAEGDDAGITEAVIAESDTTDFTDVEIVVENGQEFSCRKATVSLESAPEEFVLYDPNSDIIFPGNLIQGKTINNATPEPIPLPRGGGHIVMTSVNGAESVSRYVDEVTLDQVYDAQNQIIGENPRDLAARLTITMEQVHSKQHLDFMLQLKGEYDALVSSGSISSSLQFSQDREYNRFLVKLNQSFYTMSYRLPQSYGEVFGEGVTPESLSQYIQPDNPATFISSVTYGRIFYLLFESTSSGSEMSAALNATFSGTVVSGEVGAEINQIKNLQNVRIKAYALGGEAGDALKAVGAVQDSSSKLIDFLAQAGTIETGAPISYVIRSLKNPTKIVRTSLNTKFEITECEVLIPKLEKELFWFNNNNNSLSSIDYNAEGCRDDGLSIQHAQAINNNSSNKTFQLEGSDDNNGEDSYKGSYLVHDPNSMDYYEFGSTECYTYDETYYGYPGTIFKNTDYTIFITLPSKVVDNGKLFFNKNSNALEGMEIGFREIEGKKEVYFTHQNGVEVKAEIDENQDDISILTFVFSKANGLKLFIDGIQKDKDETEQAKQSLVNNLGAKIGYERYDSNTRGNTAFADLRGYGVAATDDQVAAITTQIQIEYGL
jgi:hypothetical protein